MQELHESITQAGTKMPSSPICPLERLCILVEKAEVHIIAWPMARGVVVYWVVWLRVGEVFSLRLTDLSLLLLLQV